MTSHVTRRAQSGQRPDFEALTQRCRDWHRADRGLGGPLARYNRYLHWAGPDADAPADPAPASSSWSRAACSPRRATDDLALAVSYFTARTAQPPDERQWQALAAAVAGPAAPNPYDVALAWAAGWRGDGVRSPFAPGHVGELAVLALIEQVRASLAGSLRLLANQVGIALVTPDEVASMAASMGMSLLGVCDCGHHLRGCTGCRTSCCFPDHDLRTWQPGGCHLRPFIDQAVRGTAQRRILGGAFAESMLFRLLHSEGRLLIRTVEWGRCEVCDRAFEGSRCPAPHPAGARSVRREPRKNQIIIPPVGETGHVPVQRWWCGQCRHLYGSAGSARLRQLAACPRCGCQPTASKAVWTLAPATPRVLEASER